MPAITVPDLTVLHRLSQASGPVRPVKSVTTAPSAFEGEGFPVRRAFFGVEMRDLDPFIHLDQMGEKPSPTSSMGFSTTATAMAVAEPSRVAIPSG
jgi:hypothetical protein